MPARQRSVEACAINSCCERIIDKAVCVFRVFNAAEGADTVVAAQIA